MTDTAFDLEAFKAEVTDAVIARLEARDRPLYSAKTLAAKLTVSERVVREKLESGEIPSFKVGGLRRVDPAAVDLYLAMRKAASDDA